MDLPSTSAGVSSVPSDNDPVASKSNSKQPKRTPRTQNQPGEAREGGASQPRPPRRARPPASSNEASTLPSAPDAAGASSHPRNQRRRKPAVSPTTIPTPRRKANFGAGLTNPDAGPSSTPRPKEQRKGKHLPQGDDLTSTLIRGLSTPPYPDCPICFSSIRPDHAIWSCSPSTPIVTSSEAQVVQYCWTSFHVKCIRSWAEKSVKEVADARRARGETNKKGDWRCPGCQVKREVVPSGYWCFCHSTSEPKPLRLSTPHSCGNSCSRPRESGCGHPCPLQCHPGPCPSCQITTRLPCYCPKKHILAFRCGIGKGIRDLSCGKPCGRTLSCGKHTCDKICHDGECGTCEVKDLARCWCGKEEQEVGCGVGEEVQCFVEGETPWIGRFGCDNLCQRFFDCGKHKCEKSCHPPSAKPAICPRSPSNVTHCPCGRNTIAPSPAADGSKYTFPARLDCSDPIPTCDAICSKPHPACDHPCTSKCHSGPCPPCMVQIVRPCRCGATTRSLSCYLVHEGHAEKEILCDKPCPALRACGRHQCRRLCCPLASLAALGAGKKGKRRGGAVDDGQGLGEERGGLHECDLVCGKMLSCGNHRCELRDHKGPCAPCLRSSFEELVCPCGRTVYEPPIPCGTRMECQYPCQRSHTSCQHPVTPHACHDDTVSCPPCSYLASKQCACGKKIVSNVRCSLEREKVSCGTVCGKLMACGFHHCERLCHSDVCGTCVAPCGKSRKSCLPNHHPCTRPCHAPSTCPETEPCQSLVTLTCPCGRIKQAVQCGRTTSSSRSGSQLTSQSAPKCTNDCQIAKRNARLADALGISADRAAGTTAATYSDELVGFARANPKFLPVVERAFADFVLSEKRTQVLPHMPPERRKFVHDLAAVYRIDTQMVDQEPHRSVQLLRRLDTRVPAPLLSTFMATTAPPPSLGKLADLRALRGGPAQASSWRSGSANATGSPSTSRPLTPVGIASAGTRPGDAGQRGWTAVVAKPALAQVQAAAATAAASASAAGSGFGSVAAPKPMSSFGGVAASSLVSKGQGVTSASGSRSGSASGVARAVSPAASAAPGGLPASSLPGSDDLVPENWEDDV